MVSGSMVSSWLWWTDRLLRQNRGTVPLGGHLDAHQSPLQRDHGAIPVNVRPAGSQAFFGALASGFGSRNIDFFSTFRRFRQHRDATAQNLGKALHHRQRNYGAGAVDSILELADAEFGNQWRVTGQNS